MKQILVRVYRAPDQAWRAEDLFEGNLVGGNTGNLLFSDAVVSALATPDVQITTWTLSEMRARPDEISERFDQVVLPFANAFRQAYAPLLAAHTDLLGRLKVPVTVTGIGAQSTLDYSMEPLAPLRESATAFLRAVFDRSPSLGVRGEFTADFVRGLGFSNVDVIGCPSMFRLGPHLPEPSRPPALDHGARIALNLTPRKALPPGWLDTLIYRHPGLTYFPQSLGDLEMMLTGGSPDQREADPTGFPNRFDHRLFTDAQVSLHLDPQTWVEELAEFDFCLGTRIHGNVAAILAGTPSYLVAHDSRTRELAEYFELPHSRIDRLSPTLDLDAMAAQNPGGMIAGHGRRFATYADFLSRHDLAHRWAAEETTDPADAWPRCEPLRMRHGRPDDLEMRVRWQESRHQRAWADAQLELATLRERVKRLTEANARLRGRLDRQAGRLDALERRTVGVPRRAARRVKGFLAD